MTRARWAEAGALLATALLVLALPQLVYPNFFRIDDAMNENLPFYREMGRLWLAGEWPILTTQTFWGGNILVDMVLSPLAPQTIVTSLVAALSGSLFWATQTNAGLNIALTMLGGVWLGRVLGLGPGHRGLLGFLAATHPVFLYFFAASWWNLASAHAWFVVALAALLQLHASMRPATYAGAVGSLCCLMASAGTQPQLAWGVIFAVTLTCDLFEHRRWQRAAVLVSVLVAAILVAALPLMAEYVATAGVHDRPSVVTNSGNFLVPSWGHVVNHFNPLYGTYLRWFDGYRYFPLPLAYATVLSLPVLMLCRRWLPMTGALRIVAVGALLLLLLAFSPQHFGPVRWPLRFLPAWSLLVAALVLAHLAAAPFDLSPQRQRRYLAALVFFACVQLFSADSVVFTADRIGLVMMFLLLGLLPLVALRRGASAQALPVHALACVLAWAILHVTWPTMAYGYWPDPDLPDTIAKPEGAGYTVGLADFEGSGKASAADLQSGQFLWYGLRSANGYSPVGHVGIRAWFPSQSPHGFFHPVRTVRNLTADAGIDGAKVHELFGIGRIFVRARDLSPELDELIESAGLAQRPLDEQRVVLEPRRPPALQGTLSHVSQPGTVRLAQAPRMREEWFDVDAAVAARTLVFARVWWPGYSATLAGQPLPVQPWRGALVRLDLPPGAQGRLHLQYEPVSWRFTRWSPVAGLVLAVGVGLALRRRERE